MPLLPLKIHPSTHRDMLIPFLANLMTRIQKLAHDNSMEHILRLHAILIDIKIAVKSSS